MLFTSPEFLFVFLPIVYLGFRLCARDGRHFALVGWLTLASMAFYAWWSPLFLILLIVSMSANYVLGRAIERAAGPARKGLAGLAIGGNLALLFYFKYCNFFLSVAADAGLVSRAALDVILPLGISFFTFQKIAYIADLYKGAAHSPKFLDFALFVFFFPQLIAGPIVHHSEVTPQYARLAFKRAPDQFARDGAIGLTIMLVGLFKKVVIADQIARSASPAFAAASMGAPIGALLGWQAALCYTVQLYFDFSGYSDMAIGLARIFGVTFPANFNSPYRASDIIDFWRRWHMTLSRFLRDYVYIPLGGARRGPARRYLNLLATMLIGGLWHGAGWTFIFWGALHGTYLLINHAWRAGGARLPRPVAALLTLLCVIVGWVFFRADSMGAAFAILRGMAFVNGVSASATAPYESLGALGAALGLLVACHVFPNTQQIMRRERPILGEVEPIARGQLVWSWSMSRASALLFGGVAVLVVLLFWDNSEFLYFNF
jgi:D-alanyl-lipoteichoic acid acyltransferase DltB (MBOAT superfamily)